jgi:hypothetical protein
MASSSAAALVFNTPELLELILACLPLKYILHANRINKTFRAVISSSPLLQRALYFRPASFSKQNVKQTLPQHINPLLVSAFPDMFDPSLQIAQEHPVHPWYTKPEALMCKEASWRPMLLTPYPIHHFKLLKIYGMQFNMGWNEISGFTSIDSGNGLTMGVLYDCMWELFLKEEMPFVRIKIEGQDTSAEGGVVEDRALELVAEGSYGVGPCCDDGDSDEEEVRAYFKSDAHEPIEIEYGTETFWT